MKPLPFILAFLLLPAFVAAGECPVPGDYLPCDGNVTITELMDYINEWYMCSACVPDLFQAIETYYNIAHCVSDCTGKVCGPDGCGGSCGTCSSGEYCSDGICYPDHCIDGSEDGDEDGIDCGGSCEFKCPTNWNSGISVLFDGTPGQDYVEELFWYKPIEDDHKVVYIKANTSIIMEHNERNIRQTCSGGGGDPIPNGFVYNIGVDGEDGIPNSGDEGVILYRVDRDLQLGYAWGVSSSSGKYPAYAGPFTFAGLDYETGTPVVGTIGGQGADLTDRYNYFYAGQLDVFGDEWHTIAFADDDEWLGCSVLQKLGSDGKVILFVVNPKTPAIMFNNLTDTAQFYTTPAKAYWVPKVHNQTTYLTDDVEIKLVNIMGGQISYRINGGATQTYTAPLDSSILNNGTNTIEYWYNTYHKTRKIVKNPGFPSEGEEHGYMLWKNDAELDDIKARLQTGSSHGYADWYEEFVQSGDGGYNRNCHRDFVPGVYLGQGQRVGCGYGAQSLANAFIAKVEGYNYTWTGETDSYAQYAKRMLLDNERIIEPMWFGDAYDFANPVKEILDRGYWDIRPIFSNVLAYDLLIKDFKSTQYSGGITQIEDYKIRDSLAKFSLESMMQMGNYGEYGDVYNAEGMWGMARDLGSLIVALAMPTYDTHYYGTSGFDDTVATHAYTPYPDYPVTWKEAFHTETNPLYTYPNQCHQFDDYVISGYDRQKLILEQSVMRNYDSLLLEAGSWGDRIGYFSRGLMGQVFYITTNVMKVKLDHTYPYWEMAFDYANQGTLYGLKEGGPTQYPQLLLINERFPHLAADAEAYLINNDYTEVNSIWGQMSRLHIYGLIFYNENWDTAYCISVEVCSDYEHERTCTDNICGITGCSWGGSSCSGVAQTNGSITQHGITWTFDTDYTYGQFANGDYWVVPDTPQGTVTIVSISPAPVNGRNGFEINPMPGQRHPYDSRVVAVLHPGRDYDASLQPALPAPVSVNSSVVSTISQNTPTECIEYGPNDRGWYTYDGSSCALSALKTAAVLTVLGEVPPDNGATIFRPPYIGNDKPLYSAANLRDDLLLSLTPVGSPPNMAEAERMFERVWIDHIPDWGGRTLHPTDNMASDFGAGISRDVGVGALRLLLDDPVQDKQTLLIRYVQLGIDLYGMVENGMYWQANGGHMSGRKYPILFAGLMLDEPGMIGIGNRNMPYMGFQEDCQTYYDDDPDYQYFVGILGYPRWGLRHCWDIRTEPDNNEINGYRFHSTSVSWVGQTLAAKLLGLQDEWNSQAYFDYMDRWMMEDSDYMSLHGSRWANDMWEAYRPTIDTCNNNVSDRCAGDGSGNGCNLDTFPIEGFVDFGTYSGGETGVDSGGPCGAPICMGTDDSCGIYPDCNNCNANECAGSVFTNGYCISNNDGCGYLAPHDCSTDCACTCDGYGTAETYYNGNCQDSKDNDCDGMTDTDPECGMPDFPPGYVSHYKFEGDVNDETGTNNGTISGDPQFVTGVQGQALEFDGNDRIDITDNSGLASLPPTYDFSVSLWAKTTSFGVDQTALTFYGTDDINVYPYWSANRAQIFWRDLDRGHTYTHSTNWGSDTWHHFTFVSYAANNHRLFVDGELAMTFTNTGTAGPFTGVRIGTFELNQWFVGTIDEVIIYDRALSQSEIQQIYCSQGGTAAFCT